jgi:threonine/homoserine/homoserine lactone efflux protein
MAPSHALLAGIAAGLAVAVPLGAIGTLVLDTGLRHGTRRALAAGMGVATVDGLYATAAAAAGASLATTLATAEETIRLVAAAVLAGVALLLLRGALARRDDVSAACSPPAPPAPRALYARFVALTVVNPMTAATFAAVTAGLPAAGGDQLSAPAAASFVIGALAASAGWHALLATASGAAGRRLPPNARVWTGAAGAALALALSARLAVAG